MVTENRDEQSVFISSAQSDLSLAKELLEAIAKSGLRPWLDTAEVQTGERWEEELENELRSARVLVLVLTPESANSAWTNFTVGAAIADGKVIIPVLSEDMDPDDMPTFLRTLQWIKASTPGQAGEAVARAAKAASVH